MKTILRSQLSASMLMTVILIVFAGISFAQPQGQDEFDRVGHEQIVQFLKEMKIVEDLDKVTIWTTPFALDSTHVIRHMIAEKSQDLRFPYALSWLVMIDDFPGANFAHPVRWVFIDAQFKMHSEVMKEDFPPIVFSEYGKGKTVLFKCWDLTAQRCSLDELLEPPFKLKPSFLRNCRYAILISGGINSAMNYGRYATNLKSMYTMLRNAGYPKSHIYVYYADGNLSLDCDNEDGDNNDATGSDVTAGAIEGTIRARFQDLTACNNCRCGVLFSYFTNHGSDNDGVCLWDLDNNGLQNGELYSPAELAGDVANSNFCRHFMIHDQCFAGDFLGMATDGNHDNLVVYAAASATEVSWGRQYMAQWEDNDITTMSVNAMHQDVVNNGNLTSTPGMLEGTAGIGDHKAGSCCCCWYWWCKYWYLISIAALVVVGVVIVLYRKKKQS
jgi:hypothetical protein